MKYFHPSSKCFPESSDLQKQIKLLYSDLGADFYFIFVLNDLSVFSEWEGEITAAAGHRPKVPSCLIHWCVCTFCQPACCISEKGIAAGLR